MRHRKGPKVKELYAKEKSSYSVTLIAKEGQAGKLRFECECYIAIPDALPNITHIHVKATPRDHPVKCKRPKPSP